MTPGGRMLRCVACDEDESNPNRFNRMSGGGSRIGMIVGGGGEGGQQAAGEGGPAGYLAP